MSIVQFNNRPVGKTFDVLFNEFVNGFPAAWEKDFQNGNLAFPPANVHQTKDAYHIELSAPGRSKEDFSISVDNGMLSISYEKKDETKSEDYKTVRREFDYQSFKRTFNLDETINAEGIQAKYENGVLKVHLPKKEETKPATKQINIQ